MPHCAFLHFAFQRLENARQRIKYEASVCTIWINLLITGVQAQANKPGIVPSGAALQVSSCSRCQKHARKRGSKDRKAAWKLVLERSRRKLRWQLRVVVRHRRKGVINSHINLDVASPSQPEPIKTQVYFRVIWPVTIRRYSNTHSR